MRNILLSTTALTMTAGIAAADVTVSGSFKLGFNDTEAASTAASGFRQAVVGSHDGTTATPAVTASANAVALKKNDNNYETLTHHKKERQEIANYIHGIPDSKPTTIFDAFCNPNTK